MMRTTNRPRTSFVRIFTLPEDSPIFNNLATLGACQSTQECGRNTLISWRRMIVRVQGATTDASPDDVTVVATPNTGDQASQRGKLFR
jgi:hypothetical protein